MCACTLRVCPVCNWRRVDVKKLFTFVDLCVSFFRRCHANLYFLVPILTDDRRRGSSISEIAKKHVILYYTRVRTRFHKCLRTHLPPLRRRADAKIAMVKICVLRDMTCCGGYFSMRRDTYQREICTGPCYKKNLRSRNSPTCTLSQNGYGTN